MNTDKSQIIKKVALLSLKDKALYGLLFLLAIGLLTRYFSWWISHNHIPHNFIHSPFHFVDYILFSILTFIVFIGYLSAISIWITIFFLSRPVYIKPKKGLKVAFLTCYVPGKEPISMLAKTLKAIKNVRYEHDTWVLDEGNDPEVKKLAFSMGVNYFTRANKRRYNLSKGQFRKKTKAGNHNSWRAEHEQKYDVVAQVDMDHIPKAYFLERTLGYFQDPSVAIVGSPEVYRNRNNWISKGGFEQSYIFHRVMQQGYFNADMPLLIGTSHVYRTCAMNKIGGYAPTIVEDHLTGMKFYENGYKGVFVPEILAEGQGPLNWSDYFNQQMRWSYGLFEIFFSHTPRIIKNLSWMQKINYFLAQMYYFTGIAVLLGIVLTSLYLIFGIYSTTIELKEWLYYSAPPFIFSQLILLYSRKFSVQKKDAPYLGIRGKFLVLGANIIYAIALLKYITGSNLKYAVTPKGKSSQPKPVPIKVFKVHILLLFISGFSLLLGIIQGHNSLILRLWGIINIITLTLIILSNYTYPIKQEQKIFARKVKIAFKFRYVSIKSLIKT